MSKTAREPPQSMTRGVVRVPAACSWAGTTSAAARCSRQQRCLVVRFRGAMGTHMLMSMRTISNMFGCTVLNSSNAFSPSTRRTI